MGLPMWTVYDHPDDFPEVYVARKFMVDSEIEATPEVMTSPLLSELRARLRHMGLVALSRNQGDDARIVETWL